MQPAGKGNSVMTLMPKERGSAWKTDTRTQTRKNHSYFVSRAMGLGRPCGLPFLAWRRDGILPVAFKEAINLGLWSRTLASSRKLPGY